MGVAKRDNVIDLSLLEFYLREDLNKRAERRMGVLDPVRVVIDNYPEGQEEWLEAVNNPEDELAGTRGVPFSREIYIERDDFMEVPQKKFYRLSPGQEVRLRYAYLITCQSVEKDAAGNITVIHCTYDPATRGGNAPDGRKVKSTIHWVSAKHGVPVEVRLFDRLFMAADPNEVPEGGDWKDNLNPHSLRIVEGLMEPALRDMRPGDWVQLERIGYFCADPDSNASRLVLNRTATLKDTWAKISQRENG